MTFLTGMLRVMIVIGSALMILGGAAAGFSGAVDVGASEMDGAHVIGLVVGAIVGLVVASITFGIVALLFQICDVLEGIRGELRRQGVAMRNAVEPRLEHPTQG